MNYIAEPKKILKNVKIQFKSCKSYSKKQPKTGETILLSSSAFEPSFMTVSIQVPKDSVKHLGSNGKLYATVSLRRKNDKFRPVEVRKSIMKIFWN